MGNTIKVTEVGGVPVVQYTDSSGITRAARIQKNIYNASADPTVNDDSSAGYEIGSRWINTADDSEWVCMDAAVGAAVWLRAAGCKLNDLGDVEVSGEADGDVLVYDGIQKLWVNIMPPWLPISGGTLEGDLVPDGPNLYDLGSAVNYWAEVHAAKYYFADSSNEYLSMGSTGYIDYHASTANRFYTGATHLLSIDLYSGYTRLYTPTGRIYIGDASGTSAYLHRSIWSCSTLYCYSVGHTGGYWGIVASSGALQNMFYVGSATGRQLVFADAVASNDDYNHDTTTNPTLFIHSTTRAATATNEWGSFCHDTSNFIYDCGKGTHIFRCNGVDYFRVKLNVYSASANPTADDDTNDGYSVGSRWINTADDTEWVCVDDSAGSAVWLCTAGQLENINFIIDGGGSTITTGSKGYIALEYAADILQWTVLADQTGSIVVDVKKSSYSGFPTTASMVGSGNKPTLSNAIKNQATPTGWDSTAIAGGDILEFVVDSVSDVQRVTVQMKIRRRT